MDKSYHETSENKRLPLCFPPEFNLTKKDIRDLIDCGIPLYLQKNYAIRRLTGEQGSLAVGQTETAHRKLHGIGFAVYDQTGEICEVELRLDEPDKETKNGKQKEVRKYLRHHGRSNLLCFPHDITAEELDDSTIPIVVCEGIKKLIALTWLSKFGLAPGEKRRFIPIAISGVWNWRAIVGKAIDANGRRRAVKGLLTGFGNINLKHRVFTILFDNDIHTNYNVKIARQRFAETVQSETEAIVYFVDLRKSDDKLGIDDEIGFWQKQDGEPEALNKGLALLETKYRVSDEIQTFLLAGRLNLCIAAADRKKCKVSARNPSGEALAVDAFNLAENDKRVKFIKLVESAFTLTDDEKTEVQRELINLADVSELLADSTKADAASASGETVETSFQALEDGRIIEQIRGGVFAVYNPNTKEYLKLDSVTDSDGTTYKPIDDALFDSKGLFIADGLTEYGTVAELIGDIQAYVTKYIDLKPLQLFIASIYILFTYIADKTFELSYINATGEGGAGKSRFGNTLMLAARRGLASVAISAASIYRIIDKFQVTLFIDEFNANANSDDAAAIIQVLNAGASRLGSSIIRQEANGAKGDFQSRSFDCYAPKIIGSLKTSASIPFNSRNIPIPMEKTVRNDIPFRVKPAMLAEAQELRNKLTLYRLRTYNDDLEASLDLAESELKAAGLTPRSIQLNTPLFALITVESIKEEFINLLRGRDETLNEEKANTLDGVIIDKIHTLLFETVNNDDDKGDVTEWNSTNFKTGDLMPEDNEICEELRLDRLRDMVNVKRSPEISAQSFGKLITGLGLTTKKITRRASSHRTHKAIIFNRARLSYLFASYRLPMPEGFNVTNVTNDDKPNKTQDLVMVTYNGNEGNNANVCYQPNSSNDKAYEVGNIGNKQNAEVRQPELEEIDEVM